MQTIARPTFASTSRLTVIGNTGAASRLARRTYAVGGGSGGGQNPHLVPADSRTDVIRQTLYPSDAVSPTSSSPTGAHHSQHESRIQAVVGDAEAHETIERAWLLFQREKREKKGLELKVKYDKMVEACEELDRLTSTSTVDPGAGAGTEKGGAYPRSVYDRAMARPSHFPSEEVKGKRGQEQRWLEARLERLVPREQWVPTETRGKGWNYDWKRPGSS